MPVAATRHFLRSVVGPDGKRHRLVVNLGESPLSWLHARGHIDDRLHRAGEQLRADWELAGLGPRVTMRWDAAPVAARRSGTAGLDPSERQMAARTRLDGAMTTAGPGLADILWRVVCAGEGLTQAEKALGWPGRAGKLVLTLALERVAGFYRIR